MKNFNGGGGFRKGGDFGGGKRFSGGHNKNREHGGHGKFGAGKRNDFHGGGHVRREHAFDTPQLFAAVCSDCGKGCEVPFRPSAEKPVYCSACFGKKKHSNDKDARNAVRVPEFRQQETKNKSTNSESESTNNVLLKQLSSLESKVNTILEIISTHREHHDEQKVAPVKKQTVPTPSTVAKKEKNVTTKSVSKTKTKADKKVVKKKK
jgi:CxxC-x17-CxxC domain-containing protein